ncbi:hypothetical protein KC19_1G037000 [Ceratodon purpureus]|uniref:Uncharacterized protein n=1 Tax=Ceratodon purpureus TaxID=3225 RepID=A0A8T0J119_CERPU|nr:hypothetical protein KC19_1G037000 [Ceratodon purpureus]
MGTKIFAFPVRGRRWCFSALVPDVPTGKYSSVVTLSQLWERLQSLPQVTDRAELIESFATAKMHKNWSELGAQPIGSFGHRMHSFGQSLLNRLPAEEQFLKTVPKDTPKVELVFPSSLNPRLVRRRLRYLAHRYIPSINFLSYSLQNALCKACFWLLSAYRRKHMAFVWNLGLK